MKTEFKGTKAPWKVHYKSPFQVVGAVVTPDKTMDSFYPGIVNTNTIEGAYINMSIEERIANANLIASAPDLLEALQSALVEANLPDFIVAKFQSAINKALGL